MHKPIELEQWQLNGNAPEAYEKYLVPAIFKKWAGYLVEQAGLKPGDRILDLCCGTGIVACTAAAHIGMNNLIAGLDINEGMLAVARKTSSRMYPEIEWHPGDASAIPFTDGSFDAVLCQQAFQFFPDPPAVLNEMYRVLVPNGRLAINVLRPIQYSPAYIILANILEEHAGTQAGAIMRSPFPSWTIEQLRDLMTDAKFRNVHIQTVITPIRFPSAEEFLIREAASSPLAGSINALSFDAREKLIADIEEALIEYTDDDGIVFPMETYIAVGNR